MKIKHIFFTLIIWFMAAVIIFVIGEIGFRIFRGQPDHLQAIADDQKRQDYLFIPNQTKSYQSTMEGEFEYSARFNNFGFRGKDITMAKPKDKIRIFVVGDSFTFGVGSNDHETIPFVLEKQLLESGFPVEVINAGQGHTSPVTHLDNIENIDLQFNPDIVLLLFDMTDLRDDLQKERNAVYDDDGNVLRYDTTYEYGKKSWWLTLVIRSKFCQWIHNKIVRSVRKIQVLGFLNYMKIAAEGKRAKAEIANLDNIKSKALIVEYDQMVLLRGRQRKEFIDWAWDHSTKKYLKKINDLLKKRDIDFLIGMYPYGIHVAGDEWEKGREYYGFEAGKVYDDLYPFEIMENFTNEYHIPFINAYPTFKQFDDETDLFFDYDGHLTPAGNKLVVKSIMADQNFQELLEKHRPAN